jgi:steroid 5-alpha reductase family enzyme
MTSNSILMLEGWGLLALAMAGLWLLQRRTGDAGVVDAAWAGGLGILAVLYALLCDGTPGRRLTLALLGGVWGLRLSTHLVRDRVLPPGEDGRYRTLRERWGTRAQPYLFLFFQAQALLAVLLSVPFLVVATRTHPFPTLFDVAAILLWCASMSGESLADRQLARFRARPENRGRTCREGLWRYSRHPNYFFEWLLWWTYPLLALPHPLAALAALSPLVLLYLILKVTGIPPTEAQALESRGEDYRAYQRSTNAFVPWLPRTPA